MSLQPYPEGFDHAWLAADQVGHVGMFITAGRGPMPEAAPNEEFEDVEDVSLTLLRTCGAKVLRRMPHPDAFLALAERGFFVFDWSDVHRTKANELRAYELTAIPDRPIAVGLLPSRLLKAANAAVLDQIQFSNEQTIDVAAHLRCIGPG